MQAEYDKFVIPELRGCLFGSACGELFSIGPAKSAP